MRKTLIVALSLVLVLSTAHAADPEVAKVAEQAISAHALMVGSLRDENCGGGFVRNQDAKNAEFAACVMYVLGAVDMIWEWQKTDPAHAPPVCVPRTVTAGAPFSPFKITSRRPLLGARSSLMRPRRCSPPSQRNGLAPEVSDDCVTRPGASRRTSASCRSCCTSRPE
jgi:hypothetical protein